MLFIFQMSVVPKSLYALAFFLGIYTDFFPQNLRNSTVGTFLKTTLVYKNHQAELV